MALRMTVRKPNKITIELSNVKRIERAQQSKSVEPQIYAQTVLPDEGYTLSSVNVGGVSAAIDSNIASENIRSGISILGVEGSPTVVNTANATATANDILFGKNAYANGEEIVGEIESYRVSVPIMPTTADQTIPSANKYVETDIVVKGDSKLLPDNIKENTTIFGVEGTVKPQNNGYQRVGGVPNGEDIIANAPDIEQGGVVYKPIYYICAMDTLNSNTFTKTGTGTATGADAYVFSDEPSTLYVGTSVSHTFNRSLDFATDEDWKCRYVIMYATAENKASAGGRTVNIYNYRATFEMIGASGTIFSSTTALFGNISPNPACKSIKYVDISACSFYNNTISGSYFCSNCGGLIEIKLPESVTTVSSHFCTSCSSLTSLSFPNLTTVSSGNFCTSCSSLTSLSLPNLTTVSGSGFCSNCYSLTSLSLPLLNQISVNGFCPYCYSLVFLDISAVTSLTDTATTLDYCRYIKLIDDFDISGVNFTGATGYTKSLDWLNNELPAKLKDNSGGTAKTMTLGAANIALIGATAAATIAAKNWTVT